MSGPRPERGPRPRGLDLAPEVDDLVLVLVDLDIEDEGIDFEDDVLDIEYLAFEVEDLVLDNIENPDIEDEAGDRGRGPRCRRPHGRRLFDEPRPAGGLCPRGF